MSAYRDKRRRDWRFDFWSKGKRFTGRGYQTRRQALDAEDNRRKQARRQETAAYVNFGALVEDFLTMSARTKTAPWAYQLEVKTPKAFEDLYELPIEGLTRAHFERCLYRLEAKGNKARSLNEYRKIAVSIMEYAKELGVVDRNPATLVPKRPEPRANPPIPTADLKKAILAAEPQTAAVLTFMSQTGCRIGEALKLKWADVDENAEKPLAVLTTRKTKDGSAKRSAVPLTHTALRAINSMRGMSPVWVFAGPRTGKLKYETARRRFMKALKAAGLDHYTSHQLRSWAATTTQEGGAFGLSAVQKLMRHENVKTTQRYIHVADSEVVKVVEHLEHAVDLDDENDAQRRVTLRK